MKKILNKLSKINKNLYIVWWHTREKILWWDYSWDIDLATDANPTELREILNSVTEVWKKYWTIIVNEDNESYELTSFRKDIWILDNRRPVEVEFTDSIEEDSCRRDFTFNAIYLDVKNQQYIDPQNWIIDLKNKTIRFIWNPIDRIKEDALRILRFVRFKNKYDFKLWNDNYLKILKSNIELLKNLSIERIKSELDKIILLDNNIQALKELKQIGFFKIFIPEIDNLVKTPWWAKHHLEWNVWVHTLMTIGELNKYFKDTKRFNIKLNIDNNLKLDLYWTMLLHDIWKNDTYSIDWNKNIHYYWHEKYSYHKSKEILKNFKFSNKSKKTILWLIENHLRVFKVFDMKTLKARKFMMHDSFILLIIVWLADHKWRLPTDDIIIEKLIKFYNKFIKTLSSKKFLNWNDILVKYPDLKWREIKNKLNALNDKILIS